MEVKGGGFSKRKNYVQEFIFVIQLLKWYLTWMSCFSI